MKLSDITQMLPSLQALSNTKLPVKAGFRVAKAMTLLKPDLIAYDEQRTKLLQELGTLNDTRTSYNFTQENGVLFAVAHQQLLDEECNLTLPVIKLSELGDLNIEPMHLAALYTIILDDEGVPVAP